MDDDEAFYDKDFFPDGLFTAKVHEEVATNAINRREAVRAGLSEKPELGPNPFEITYSYPVNNPRTVRWDNGTFEISLESLNNILNDDDEYEISVYPIEDGEATPAIVDAIKSVLLNPNAVGARRRRTGKTIKKRKTKKVSKKRKSTRRH